MDSEVLSSVIIPAYNAEKYVLNALESVRSQTCQDFEIVVMNDGSTDRTHETLLKYRDEHPEISINVLTQENQGIGWARNNCIFQAKGKYVALLDADDIWFPNKLERIKAYLCQHLDVGLVCHDEILVKPDGSSELTHFGPPGEPLYEHLLFKDNTVSVISVVMLRSLVLEVKGFSVNPDFHSAEDYELWLRLAKTGAKFGYIPEALAEYRVGDTSISQKVEYHCEKILNVLNHHFEELKAENRYSPSRLHQILKKRTSMTTYLIGRTYHHNSQYKKAFKAFLRAISEYPFWLKNYLALGQLLMICLLSPFRRG